MAGLAALALNAGPSHSTIICSVRWNRRGPARSLASSPATWSRRQSMTLSIRAVSVASRTSGPWSATTAASSSRSRNRPSSLPYQASSARRAVPQPGSSSSRKVRRLARILRMATRVWWIRSVGSCRRSVPLREPTADWAHSGRVPMDRWRASTVPVRLRSSSSSSPRSFRRNVRAAMASTRWSTMPAVGSGKTSSWTARRPAEPGRGRLRTLVDVVLQRIDRHLPSSVSSLRVPDRRCPSDERAGRRASDGREVPRYPGAMRAVTIVDGDLRWNEHPDPSRRSGPGGRGGGGRRPQRRRHVAAEGPLPGPAGVAGRHSGHGVQRHRPQHR